MLLCHTCGLKFDIYSMVKEKNIVYKIINLMLKFYESNYYSMQFEHLNKFREISLDCYESMTAEKQLKEEVNQLNNQ